MIFFISMSDRGVMFHHRRGWQQLLSLKFNVKYKFYSRKKFSHYKFIFNIILKLFKSRPKIIIFINGEYSPFIFLIHFISYLTRTKVIVSWHDVTPHNGGILNYLYWLISFINSLISYKVIIYNEAYKNSFFLHNKFIYFPLPPIRLPLECNIKIFPKKNGSIVFIGRVEYYKGLDRILECYLFPDMCLHLRQLIIIGNCPENYKYKKLFKNSDSVFFLGSLSDIDAYNLMLSCDAIIMPHRHCSQSTNPYWAGITKSALIISREVDQSLSIAKHPGVYTFSDRTQLLSYINIKSKLTPFNHEFYSYELGLFSLVQICNE